MTDNQRKVLADLAAALAAATDCGVLEYLAFDLHPDVINGFCDRVSVVLVEASQPVTAAWAAETAS